MKWECLVDEESKQTSSTIKMEARKRTLENQSARWEGELLSKAQPTQMKPFT
jgi:hypothetical protein